MAGHSDGPSAKEVSLLAAKRPANVIEFHQYDCYNVVRRGRLMGSQELLSSVFHFPAGIMIDSIAPSANELVLGIACEAPSMPCPECQQPSFRMHGHYQRTVADLPCAGRTVILALTVRKFVCSTPGCPRSIFTERLPGLVQSYAR